MCTTMCLLLTAHLHRWDVDSVYHPAAHLINTSIGSQVATRFGTYLPEVHDFDAAAFALSAGEAGVMDPQQVTW